MRRLAEIWRYPIKGHGRETLAAVAAEAGRTLPWDRHWAVAHEAAQVEGGAWAPCAHFSRGAKAPKLMAISAQLDEATRTVTLHHPDQNSLTFQPDTEQDAFLEWIAPLMPPTRAASARVVSAGERGMTDTDFPSISLNNPASHRAVSQKLGQPISHLRWRGNLWIEGLGPWEEFEWIGRTLRIGAAEFSVKERIERCRATMANPDTGRIDVDTLRALEDGWGHTDFGVHLICTKSGPMAVGDSLEILT